MAGVGVGDIHGRNELTLVVMGSNMVGSTVAGVGRVRGRRMKMGRGVWGNTTNGT
jgi:hypothetical protein